MKRHVHVTSNPIIKTGPNVPEKYNSFFSPPDPSPSDSDSALTPSEIEREIKRLKSWLAKHPNFIIRDMQAFKKAWLQKAVEFKKRDAFLNELPSEERKEWEDILRSYEERKKDIWTKSPR